MPTDHQRKQLCELLYYAFVQIRLWGWRGDAERAAALADACHNLPLFLWRPGFDWKLARYFFEDFQRQYGGFDFVTRLKEIEAETTPPSPLKRWWSRLTRLLRCRLSHSEEQPPEPIASTTEAP